MVVCVPLCFCDHVGCSARRLVGPGTEQISLSTWRRTGTGNPRSILSVGLSVTVSVFRLTLTEHSPSLSLTEQLLYNTQPFLSLEENFLMRSLRCAPCAR